MQVERTITLSEATKTTATITITKEVVEKTAYADGDNVNLGRETKESFSMDVFKDGERLTSAMSSMYRPEVLSPLYNEREIAAGAYAKVVGLYVGREKYDLISAAIAEIEAELDADGTEYRELKAQETAREQSIDAQKAEADAEYKRQLSNGLCQKCGSYCYGDCEAN